MLVAKLIFLQAYWYIAVVFGAQLNLYVYLCAAFFAICNYFLYGPKIEFKYYLLFLVGFSLYGFIEQIGLEYLGLVNYIQDTLPLWLNALYLVFLCYYGDAFNYLSNKPTWLLTLMGAVGGAFAFYGGVKLSNIEALSHYYYLAISISWAFFFPVSIRLFYQRVTMDLEV